jgi:hypothetical protein
MHVCMYVCICALPWQRSQIGLRCEYVCMYVCMCASMLYVCVSALYQNMYMCMYVYVYVCMTRTQNIPALASLVELCAWHIHTYKCTYILICTWEHGITTCDSSYIHTYIHIYIHACIHTYIHRNMGGLPIATFDSSYVRTYIHTYIHRNMGGRPIAIFDSLYVHTYVHT